MASAVVQEARIELLTEAIELVEAYDLTHAEVRAAGRAAMAAEMRRTGRRAKANCRFIVALIEELSLAAKTRRVM